MKEFQDRYVNPLTDFGFKRLFGTEPNKDILLEFLNAVLPDGKRIMELQFGNSERIGRSPLDRKAIFDVYCISESGEHFIVELQKVKQNFFKDRTIYYSSFPIQDQGLKGDWDFQLDAVYTVGILDFIFNDHAGDEEFYHVVELKDQRNEVFSDKLKFVYVELPKFKKSVDELNGDFEKWIYLFRHLAGLQKIPDSLEQPVFHKLFKEAEIANFSREEMSDYIDSLKYFRDLNNVVDTAYGEGREDTLLEVARKLKSQGASVAMIVSVTGLSETEVGEL